MPEGKYTDGKAFLSFGIMLSCQRIYGQDVVGPCMGDWWGKYIEVILVWFFFLLLLLSCSLFKR